MERCWWAGTRQRHWPPSVERSGSRIELAEDARRMNVAGPPILSPEQRAAALEKAGAARRGRAEVRESLRTGGFSLQDVLMRSNEEIIGGMKVKAVLTALPGLGKVKSYRLMERLGIADNRRVRGLGPKQRKALIDALS